MAIFNSIELFSKVIGSDHTVPFVMEWSHSPDISWQNVPAFSTQRLSLENTLIRMDEQKPLWIRVRTFESMDLSPLRAQFDSSSGSDDLESYTIPQCDLSVQSGVAVYDPKSKVHDAYPFACGFYRIKVTLHEHSWYFALEIRALNITGNQLQFLNEYIERHVYGLSKSFESTSLAVSSQVVQMMDITYWLERYWHLLLRAIARIERENAFALRPTYVLERVPRRQTAKSINLQERKQAQDEGQFLNRRSVVTTDTPINRIVKYAIHQLANRMREYEQSLFLQHKQSQSSEARHRLQRDITQIAYQKCKAILSSPFWREIGLNADPLLRLNAQLPKHYRDFFELLAKLDQPHLVDRDYIGKLGEGWTFSSRPTQELYEYFVFLLTFDVVSNLGFEMTGLSSQLRLGKTNQGLNDGEWVSLQRGMQRIDLVFNEQLPARFEQAQRANQDFYLLLANHRKPDIRMDRYEWIWYSENEQDGYWKIIESVVIEVKYRPFRYLYNNLQTLKPMEQMRDYRMLMWANDPIDNSTQQRPIFSIRPLTKDVICVYPGLRDREPEVPPQQVLETGLYLQIRPESEIEIFGREFFQGYFLEWLGE